MAEKIFNVVQLDDGSITVDAPASEFPDKGYFTLYDKSASAKGMKGHSFHKFTERHAYTKENFAIKKDEENPNWTCLVAPVDKDGETIPDTNYVPRSMGLVTLGKKGLSVLPDKDGKDRQSMGNASEKDKTILANLTMSWGLNIPTASNPEEPNLRCRMYRNKYPDVEETVVVLVKRIDVMGVYVNLIEYDDTEGMILLSELSRRRIRSVKKLVEILSTLVTHSFCVAINPLPSASVFVYASIKTL